MTSYITFFSFGRGKAVDISVMLTDMQGKQNSPWHHPFNISTDSPNINKAFSRLFNNDLREQGFNGLFPFISCSLHVIRNAFTTGIGIFDSGVEQIAFDLHA